MGKPVEIVKPSESPESVWEFRVAVAITRTGVGIVPDDIVVVTFPFASLMEVNGDKVKPPVYVVAAKETVTPGNPTLVWSTT